MRKEWHQLAPFILGIRDHVSSEGKAWRVNSRTGSWSLHRMVKGRGKWTSNDGKLQILRERKVLLSWRVVGGKIHQGPGSHYQAIFFDLAPRARRFVPGDGWWPENDRGDNRQPGPKALLGYRPEPILKDHLGWEAMRMMEKVCHRWSRSERDQVVSNLELANWLTHLIQGGPENSPKDVERVVKAEDHAKRNLLQGCGVDEMSRASGLNPQAFLKVYKDLRGETPGSFLKKLRLETAQHLLKSTALRVDEVAVMSGYRDRTVLYRALKNSLGLSPKSFRS